MPPTIIVSRGATPVTSYEARLRDAGASAIAVGPRDPIPESFDALCLSGGPDVWWRLYGEPRRGSLEPDVERDYLEIEQLLPRAFALQVPVLAICRGLQVLNVYLGGTLTQDIGEDHRATHDDVKPHPVRVDPGSRLGAACGVSFTVNSRHHQVLDRLASALEPTAWSDPYIEAAEIPGDHWVVGVQWHPERVQDSIANNGVGIFEAFVKATQLVAVR